MSQAQPLPPVLNVHDDSINERKVTHLEGDYAVLVHDGQFEEWRQCPVSDNRAGVRIQNKHYRFIRKTEY